MNALSPAQLEILCHEWLREHRQFSHLVASIRRGLKDVDIAGARRDGRRIFAQVTFSAAGAALDEKAVRLRSVYPATDEAILFADCAAGTVGGGEVVPIADVFTQSRSEVLCDLLRPE